MSSFIDTLTLHVKAGDGGSGRIIIAYAGSQRGSGGSVATSGGFTRHTFNYTGNLQTYTG